MEEVDVIVSPDETYLNPVHFIDNTEEEPTLHEGVQKVFDLMQSEVLESPIDIDLRLSTKLEVPKLVWHHMDLHAKKTKLTNTGHTLIISAKWLQERPYLSGGPFIGKYVFSQIHFHWGQNNMEGSEHTISGTPLPLEMHAVFFKSCYLTQESALKKKDGMCVLCFMFKLQEEINPSLQMVTDIIYQVRDPSKSTPLGKFALNNFMKPFTDDYFLYVGNVTTTACVHQILWIICREPMGISVGEADLFRTTLDGNYEPLVSNFRPCQPLNGRILYHANPSGQRHTTLLVFHKEFDGRSSKRPQQMNKQQKSSKEYVPYAGTTIYRTDVFTTNPFQHKENNDEGKKKRTYKLKTLLKVDEPMLQILKIRQSHSLEEKVQEQKVEWPPQEEDWSDPKAEEEEERYWVEYIKKISGLSMKEVACRFFKYKPIQEYEREQHYWKALQTLTNSRDPISAAEWIIRKGKIPVRHYPTRTGGEDSGLEDEDY